MTWTLRLAQVMIGGMATATSALAVEGTATDYWARVMPAVWLTQLGGDASYQGTSPGTASQLGMRELGLQRRKAEPSIEAGVNLPLLVCIDAGYSSYSSSGSQTLSRTIRFGNQTYTQGTVVSSSVALRDGWGELTIRPLDLDRVGFAIGIAGHLVHGRLELEDAGLGLDESLAKTLPIPVLALRAHVTPIARVTIEGRLHYIDAGIKGDHARFADAAIQASYRPLPFVGILGGFRYTGYDIHLRDPRGGGSSASLRLHLSGPYAGVMAEF